MIDWSHWHNEPYLIGGLIVIAWLYALFTGPFRAVLDGTAPFPRREARWFYSGIVVFYLAVGSPLDQIGERFLLAAHMVQHQLLMYVAAVCFLKGLPPWIVAPVFRRRNLRRILKVLLHPISCGLIYTLVLSLWHAPALYDWALRDKVVHVWEHLMFFGAALLYWWPILSPTPLAPRSKPGAQILYLTAVTIGMTPLFAFIAFSETILYPTYEYAPRLIPRLGPQEDQLLGAAIMKMGSLMMLVAVAGWAFYQWARKDAIPDEAVVSPRPPASGEA